MTKTSLLEKGKLYEIDNKMLRPTVGLELWSRSNEWWFELNPHLNKEDEGLIFMCVSDEVTFTGSKPLVMATRIFVGWNLLVTDKICFVLKDDARCLVRAGGNNSS